MKKNLIFLFLGEALLLLRTPSLFVYALNVFPEDGVKLFIYFLYSCALIISCFLIYEFKINNKSIKLSKNALKYALIFIIPIIFDLILNMNNAINQLVILLEDLFFFGLDYIIIMISLFCEKSRKKVKDNNNSEV